MQHGKLSSAVSDIVDKRIMHVAYLMASSTVPAGLGLG